MLSVVVPGAVVGALYWSHSDGRRERFTGTPIAAVPAPPLNLPDDDGGRFNISDQRGSVVLVYFGYAHCPDVCPATLGQMADVLTTLGHDAAHVRSVFVTLDPNRDTPPLLRQYLSNFTWSHGRVPLGLTGSPHAVAAAARAWGVSWRPAEGGAFIDHTSVVTAVGPDGRLRLRYGFSQMANIRAVALDIRHLLGGA